MLSRLMASDVFTPEQTAHNVRTAEEALARSDLAHALFHISSALSTDPMNVKWRQMLDHVIQRAPDALTLARLDEAKADFITAATRAYILAAKQQYAEALELLAEVFAARPDAPFLQWGQEWVRLPGAVESLPREFMAGGFLSLVLPPASRAPCPMTDDDPRIASVRAIADILAVFRHYVPEEPFLLFGSSLVLRRLGAFDEAIYYAYQALQRKADWASAIGLACAYRDAKKVDEAVQTYRYALSFNEDDLSARIDIGDTLLEADRIDEAIAAYEEVLAKQADHPWAKASILYARYKKSGDAAAKADLFKMGDQNARAWELFCRIQKPELYIHELPGPGDATAHALRNVMRQVGADPAAAQGGRVDLKVTHPESPSVLTAFRLWTDANRLNVGVGLEVERVQTPDPRTPKGQVEVVLWAYDGTTARPNVPAPDPRGAQAVASIAKEPFNLELWDGPAKSLAEQMGPAWAQQLMFTMVHPPPLPSPTTDPFDWVARVQIAAALVLAHLDAGWEGSTRKRALYSIACGPTDWTMNAAIIVLAWLSRADAAVRKDVEALFGWLEGQVPRDGFTCWEHPLVCSWIAMGGHDEQASQRLAAWRDRVEKKVHEHAPETHEGLTLEQYAELSVRRDEIVMGGSPGMGGALMAMVGAGTQPELAKLCKEYGIDATMSAAAGRVPAWDERINDDPEVQRRFFTLQEEARLKRSGVDPGSHEGRVARMIREGSFDVQAAGVNAAAAAQQMAAGQGGDPDPVVFPGQRIERLSHYVALMKGMQGGDFNGALARAGLDMGTYVQVAQAWGVKLASDPVLTAKFSQMMAG
jgi:tetratricopeptide (TPR) repeat protein